MTGLIITIDGPAGAGKGTMARRLAQQLGLAYLDTGTVYRATALTVLNIHLNPLQRQRRWRRTLKFQNSGHAW